MGTESFELDYYINANVIRTSKTKNGVTTEYYLNGSDIVAEETNGNFTVYIYDADGSILGFQYRGANYFQNAWDTYFFEKNLQGDVVAIYDEDCNKLVSYTYDAWGNFTRTYTNGGQNTVAAKNPFTYRGYYYDYDLKFYYLNSRYYDPYIGRFINADDAVYHDVLGYNMFIYCFNNPVGYYDPSGESPIGLTLGGAALVKEFLGIALVATVAVIIGILAFATADVVAEVINEASQNNNNDDSEERIYSVYALVDPKNNNKVEYIGRTKNLETREAAHKASATRGHLEMKVIEKECLTKNEARALEQYYMLQHHTLNAQEKVNNQINGVSPRNKKIDVYIEAARNYLANNVNNEYLNWKERNNG